MITRRENLLRVFRHEEPEWVPITTLSDDYNKPSGLPAAFYRDTHGLDATRELAHYFDVDVVDRCGATSEVYRNVQYARMVEGEIETQRWETPHGVITARTKRVEYPGGTNGEPNLTTAFPIEYPVKSVDDYQAFGDIFEDMDYVPQPEAVAQRMQETGDAGIVTAGGQPSPLGMCVRLYMGVEHLAFAYKDHPHELRELLEKIADNYLRCYRAIAQTPADGTINYDDTTTYAISPAMFRELEVPYLNQTADILHAAGKFCIHHACGHVQGLLRDFRATRIDGFDGPAAPPIGNTTVAQARERLGMDVAIMPFTEEYAMRSGDPRTIRASIRSMFEQANSPRNFIVDMVAPPALHVSNLWIAVDEAKRLSRTFF
jgi:hypothetical protein